MGYLLTSDSVTVLVAHEVNELVGGVVGGADALPDAGVHAGGNAGCETVQAALQLW